VGGQKGAMGGKEGEDWNEGSGVGRRRGGGQRDGGWHGGKGVGV